VLYALACTPLRRFNRPAFIRAHFHLQIWWARTLYGAMERAFKLTTVVTGQDDALRGGGPIVVMVRHVSQIDALLPAAFVSHPSRIVLRYVLKHELLWSPAMDLVGNRLPNHFVRRKAMSARREIHKIFELGQGMGANDGAIIFPEGTRFSEKKRRQMLRVLAKRAKGDIYEKANQLKHVLPPNIAGPKALLEAAPTSDVVFVVHTGFEGMRTPKHLFAGGIVGRTIRIHLWRVPRDEFARQDIERWLLDQWRLVDGWVDAHSVKQPDEG